MEQTLIEEKYNEGCSALSYGKFDKAEKIFLEILNETDDYYPAINKLGVVQAQRRNLEAARNYFEKCLDIKEEYGPALVNLGSIYKESGDNESAEKYYLYSTQCDPDYYLAYYNLSVLCKERKDFNSYMKYVKEYKKLYRKSIRNDIKNRRFIIKKKFGKLSYMFFVATFLIIILFMIFLR